MLCEELRRRFLTNFHISGCLINRLHNLVEILKFVEKQRLFRNKGNVYAQRKN